MGDWQARYRSRVTSAAAAVEQTVRAGTRVMLQPGCAEPQALTEALVAQRERLRDVTIVTSVVGSPAIYAKPEFAAQFHLVFLMAGVSTRAAMKAGMGDYIPVHLHDMARLFRDGHVGLDVAFIQVSPPDRHGYCTYGVHVDWTDAGVRAARVVVAEVNRQMPRAHGEAAIHVSRIDHVVEVDRPIIEIAPAKIGAVERRIGEHVASLIPDGATVQWGIGAIPDAALCALGSHRELGVHTGTLSDGIIDLVEAGVVTNARKTLQPGLLVTTGAVGTRRIYDFVDDNPLVQFFPSEYTHDARVLAQLDHLCSINSALQVDLTGQVNGETLGGVQLAGTGGQADFVRGASLSRGGKSIIALPATAAGGKASRIVAALEPGTGVSTSRADVHYVVTEYGIADLRGKALRERAQALTAIAHPEFRAELERFAAQLP